MSHLHRYDTEYAEMDDRQMDEVSTRFTPGGFIE
jgi:hypothetical protein